MTIAPTAATPDATAALATELHTIVEPGTAALMAAFNVLIGDIQTLTNLEGADKATIAALTAHVGQLQATVNAAQGQLLLVASSSQA